MKVWLSPRMRQLYHFLWHRSFGVVMDDKLLTYVVDW